MVSFLSERFPADISYGISGGPCFDTEIVETHSGIEYRNIRMPYARNKYNIASGIRTKKQLDEVMRFFRAAKGRALGFRFKDWLDYKAVNEFIGYGDASKSEYQLTKTYSIGLDNEIRYITKPVVGSVSVYIDKKQTRLYKLDYETGLLSFPKAPPVSSKVSATFEFDVPVRFNSDYISASLENYNSHSFDDIELVEIFT